MGKTAKAFSRMREVDLYPVLRTWLEEHGWECYAEVCAYSDPWPVDIVAQRPDNPYLLAIEMKTGFTKDLIRQGTYLSMFALYPYVAAPTKPNDTFLAEARRRGFGVLRVTDGIQVVQKPKIRFKDLWKHYWRKTLEEISVAGDIHQALLAGVPNGELGRQYREVLCQQGKEGDPL